ncbi:hypothetical protein CH376_03630 [Leptospira adleri]|uniref:Uncharacterized protein n=2 Tax=Leptospira adleri TaxID=2023186 RepID=A0ABX4P560_9LEPT|nr:hypothetical protein CH376_03630 [Leptospira adleri]
MNSNPIRMESLSHADSALRTRSMSSYFSSKKRPLEGRISILKSGNSPFYGFFCGSSRNFNPTEDFRLTKNMILRISINIITTSSSKIPRLSAKVGFRDLFSKTFRKLSCI